MDGDRRWYFMSKKLVEANGWNPADAQPATSRDMVNIPYAGVIDSADPERYGPASRSRPVSGETTDLH